MRYAPINLANNVAMTQTINTNGINLNQIGLYSVQVVWTGSPVGQIKLQISNDPVQVVTSPMTANPAGNVVNWSDYSGTPQVVNGAGSFFWKINDVSELWVRVVYLFTSGTGSLLAQAVIKGDGARS
jgi:hypothetical protein